MTERSGKALPLKALLQMLCPDSVGAQNAFSPWPESCFIYLDSVVLPVTLASFVFQNFCVKGLELFSSYLFKDILELYDWNLIGNYLV